MEELKYGAVFQLRFGFNYAELICACPEPGRGDVYCSGDTEPVVLLNVSDCKMFSAYLPVLNFHTSVYVTAIKL